MQLSILLLIDMRRLHPTLLPASLVTIVLVAASVPGCSPRIINYSSPGEFARALFVIANEGNESQWGAQLTKARRAMGHDYIHKHFAKYQTLMLELEEGPLGGDLSKAQFRVEDGALEFQYDDKWVTIFRVDMEDGGWKINQD